MFIGVNVRFKSIAAVSPWTTISDGCIMYRRGLRDGFYIIDFSSDCGINWEEIVSYEPTEEIAVILANPGTDYRVVIRDYAMCVDHVLTPTGFAGLENTDWEEIQSYNGYNWDVPQWEDVLRGTNGTIITIGTDHYFQGIGGINFLITGYDFPTGWTKGIPYKSAATISAPVGDDVFIAADVNNFWYAADGTPNQIPVVSLFQDIDYANKIFFKHAAQVVDGNGIETYEPRILEWAIYSSARTGADLTTCQTYFGVPVELTTGMKWVDTASGVDQVANGAKTAPYKTIVYAISRASAGNTIYVKSGIYTEGSGGAGFNILLQKALNIQGVGFTQVRGGGDKANPIIRIDVTGTVNLNNLIVDGTTGYDNGVRAYTANKTLNSCFIRNIDVTAVDQIGNGAVMNYCVVTEKYVACLAGASTINTCYIYSANAGVLTVNEATAVVTILNSRFQTRNGNNQWLNFSVATSITLKGNTFNIDNACYPLYCNAGLNATIEYSYNIFNATALLVQPVIGFSGTTSGSSFNIHHNTINISHASNANHVISIQNSPAPVIDNNIIISESTLLQSAIRYITTGANLGAATITNNSISCKQILGYHICIGAEATTAGDDDLSGTIITGNKIWGAGYHDPSLVGLGVNAVHGIFVGFNSDCVIKYNQIYGAGYGIIKKASGMSDDAGVIAYNIVVNSANGIRSKGMANMKVYGNTILNSTAIAIVPIHFTNNAGTNECEGALVKNNIVSTPLSVCNIIVADSGSADLDYNTYHGDTYSFDIDGTIYSSLAAYQAGKSLDVHSVNNDPELTDYIPDTPLTGIDLGVSYDDGLDITTVWGDEDECPVVVTKQQGATWQKGAFIQ